MTSELLEDRYQIVSTLGSGGFGETFLAEDLHMPSRRRCVVKRLHSIEHNPQIDKIVRERFQREAAILEDLGKGNGQIPELYAYFYRQQDDRFYLVQAWIDGETLSEIVAERGTLAEAEVRRILIAILPVLDYVHGKSIVHRDVKPANIILRRADRQPVLIDFGAVREIMGTVLTSQGRPSKSITIGTPGYMSSEQSVGRAVYSSDLYSLGLTAIYLLTGKEPSEFATDPQTTELIWRADALPVSANFARILDRAIATHPRDRYQTATEFLATLQDAPTVAVAPVRTRFTPTRSRPRQSNYLPLIGWLAFAGAGLAIAMLTIDPHSIAPIGDAPIDSHQERLGNRFAGLPRLDGMATVEMKVKGKLIVIELDGVRAPLSAGNFVDLVQRGFYHGLTFDRVVRQPQPFVVQGGDPTGTGEGGFVPPGASDLRRIPLEIAAIGATTPNYNQEIATPSLPHKRGVIALARGAAIDSASSQFYFALADLPVLDGKYAVFGKITLGIEVIDTILPGDRIDSIRVIDGINNLHKN